MRNIFLRYLWANLRAKPTATVPAAVTRAYYCCLPLVPNYNFGGRHYKRSASAGPGKLSAVPATRHFGLS